MNKVLNAENQGTTDLFSPTTVVETRGRLSAGGWERMLAPEIPTGHSGLLTQLETYQHLAAEAACTGEEAAILSALETNPLVGTRSRALALLNLARKQYGPLIPALA